MSEKISAGSAMPAISVPKLGGGELDLGGNGAWRMVIVYRGKHCPICKRYLSGIEALQGEIDDLGQVQIVDISNAPFARPEIASILRGIRFIQEKGYPIRGTA